MQENERTNLLTLYSDVRSIPVRWLWYPYIAYGKITLLQGDPGDGKSTMMMNLIAELSVGGKMPDGKPLGRPQRVIYQCSEDGVGDTIKPRLERYGADCRNVAFINEEVCGGLTLDDERLREAIIEFRPKLVVIDPIQAYIGSDSDLQKAGRARKLMHRLGMWASTYDCAIVLIGHLNKKEGSKDLYRSIGSQSDVSSLAILYMGKKLIIVGDDKQVSPMAIGVEVDKINALQQMYIQNKIPNYHLYDAKTSIYDIAKTTFQPLMLREHFRCVPEIIGFSNMLSYNDEIKPLRDASSSSLLPAVVNYRVENGQRQRNKTNPNEAEAIVALLQSCLEQPEYKGKTFGVISLLGDEQVKVIQRLIEEKIDHNTLIGRNILCGNASNFQGDERDVIFLSVVDSSEDGKPIKLQGFGTDDAFRKRYNVAASRARDQLWVVDSLNPSTDLKPGDIRKTLIDYSINPSVSEQSIYTSEYNEESPLQTKLVKELQDRGFKLERHRSVGAYCLELVAVCENNAVAIECDGERLHGGITEIRSDMERQTILERLGWKFIRIRGSEYFLNPNETMNRIVKELSDFGIKPSDNADEVKSVTANELLVRVTSRASQILAESKLSDEESTTVATKNEQ